MPGKYSDESKARIARAAREAWAKLTPAQRRARTAPLSAARWGGVGKRKRLAHSQKMAEARWGKKRDEGNR